MMNPIKEYRPEQATSIAKVNSAPEVLFNTIKGLINSYDNDTGIPIIFNML